MEIQRVNQATQLELSTESLKKKDCFLKLTAAEKEIALCCIELKIKELSENTFKTKMLHLIGQTHLNCGFKTDENQVEQTIDELCLDLLKYNSTLSFQEIELAFKNGWKKQYGDFFGLNNATYFQWVNAYTWGEKRLKVKKTLLEAKENEKIEPAKKTEAEIDAIMRDACLRSFDDFKKKILVVDAGNVKYNYLVKCGLINFTKERKQEIRAIVESRMRTQAIENRQKSETIEKSIAKILTESIISESRREALVVFYKDLVETETELIDLLN
jgi:hypothetical protein